MTGREQGRREKPFPNQWAGYSSLAFILTRWCFPVGRDCVLLGSQLISLEACLQLPPLLRKRARQSPRARGTPGLGAERGARAARRLAAFQGSKVCRRAEAS